jgi:GNAT superfamily N-acetyltransferase
MQETFRAKAGQECTIKPCQPAHFEEVRALLSDAGMLNQDRDSPTGMQHVYETRPESRLVALSQGRVLGSGFVNLTVGEIPLIQAVVVDQTERRGGIGTAIVKTLVARLSDSGFKLAELQVDSHKLELREWYRKLGFISDYVCIGMVCTIDPNAHPVSYSQQLRDAFDVIYKRYAYAGCVFEPRLDTTALRNIWRTAACAGALSSVDIIDNGTVEVATTPHVTHVRKGISPSYAIGAYYLRQFSAVPTMPGSPLLLRIEDDLPIYWKREVRPSSGTRDLPPYGYYVVYGGDAFECPEIVHVDNDGSVTLDREGDDLLQSLVYSAEYLEFPARRQIGT